MKTTHLTASTLFISAVTAAGAHAAMTGVTSTNYSVTDGARRYSVMDVYVDFTGAYDKLVNFYGTTGSTSVVMASINGVSYNGPSIVAGNGAGFAQASGTSWMPAAGAAGNAWDSFVTIGARTQDAATAGIAADDYFTNATTVGADTVAGGSTLQGNYAGAGWYTNLPSGNHVYAGTYADKRIMLGRFSVETTNLAATDVLTLQFKGNVTVRVDGLSAGAGTVSQPSFNQTFAYGFVPAPGAIALLGLAGLMGRRRR
jgi:hypothetical protein